MKHNYCLLKGFRQGVLLSMLRKTLIPSRHFSLDDTWVDAVTPVGESLSTDLPNQCRAPTGEILWTCGVTFWQASREYLKCAPE